MTDDKDLSPGQSEQLVDVLGPEVLVVSVADNRMRAFVFGRNLLHRLEGVITRGVVGQDDLKRLVVLRQDAADGIADEGLLFVGNEEKRDRG